MRAGTCTPRLVRVGDVVRCWGGFETALVLGHRLRGGAPVSWRARFVPRPPDEAEVFETYFPYDFADRDLAAPGGLVCAADAWSCWTEGSP